MAFSSHYFFSIAFFAGAATIARAADYSVALIGIGPTQAPAVAMGINASGEVTGFSAGPLMQAFVFQNGQGTSLGTVGGTVSLGYAINDAGTVAGYFCTLDSGVNQFGFVHSSGQTTTIASPDGDIGVNAINASGVAAGVRYSSDGTNGQAFISSNGSIQYIGTLPGATGSFASGINDAGQVVGQAFLAPGYDHRAFLYADGTMTDLGTLGGPDSWATAINNQEQIVGAASLATTDTHLQGRLGVTLIATHAFLYSDGSMIDLGTLGGDDSQADALNDLGQVVGWSEFISGKVDQHAFLYSDGAMIDLNTLINADSGWILQEATGINDAGQITGNGIFDGQAEAFLLTPDGTSGASITVTPEPATLSLLALAATPLLRRRR